VEQTEQAQAVTPPQGDEAGTETLSAGEEGAATDAPSASGRVEVIVGEIPVADDPTRLRWTVRCSDSDHDLLGDFETRQEAERARDDHLQSAHAATP
jgi:hypothetical protein